MKLNLIWQTNNGDETWFDQDYITDVLFAEFEQNRVFDNKQFQTVLDNSVIIYSYNFETPPQEFFDYINKFIEKGYTFYLHHTSNEALYSNYDYYKMFKRVFRTSYNPNISLDHVRYVPLGFKRGFDNKEKDFTMPENKVYDFTFIGQAKSDRPEMLEQLRKFNSFIHTTEQWNCPTQLSADECKEKYAMTKFAPCPMGWTHPDSFRIMETLESRTIPILRRYTNLDYFTTPWGEAPIPVVESWEELGTFAKMSDDEYRALYKIVFDWYAEFRAGLAKSIKEQITQ